MLEEGAPRRRRGKAAARRLLRKSAVTWPAGLVLALTPLLTQPHLGTIRLLHTPQTPHEAYAYRLIQGRDGRGAAAAAWLEAAGSALRAPRVVELPYRAAGSFDAAGPPALGFAFTVAADERVRIEAAVAGSDGEAFVDLYSVADGGFERLGGSWPASAATDRVFAALEPTQLVLRLQPALAAGGDYRVAIVREPLLSFPVTGRDTRAIGSGFGAERDGGSREHRGVDIFAPRGTPVVAATDAWVVRVETTPVGGNVVWTQELFGALRLYYAHLDTQLVASGDFVRAGEPIGTVGNTGNAITTPPHLHFGVYLRRLSGGTRRGGAVDPAPMLR